MEAIHYPQHREVRKKWQSLKRKWFQARKHLLLLVFGFCLFLSFLLIYRARIILRVGQGSRVFSYFTLSEVDADYQVPGECEKTEVQNTSQWRKHIEDIQGFQYQSGAKGILKLRFKYRISVFLSHLLHFSLLYGRHYQTSISTILQSGSFQKPYFISDISKGLSKGKQNRRQGMKDSTLYF